jgi:O-antigen ligase
MTLPDLLILALFAWYVSYVLIKTDGPFKIFSRLRAVTTLGGLLACIWCLIIWIGLIAYLLYLSPFREIVYVGAIAGAGMMMHRYTGGEHG